MSSKEKSIVITSALRTAIGKFNGSLKGTLTLTAGLGGMGGAQPLAVTMKEGINITVEEAASGSDPFWSTEPTFDSSYTTSDTISITALAYSDPVANGIEYDDNGTLPSGVESDSSSGDITGTPDTVAEYYVVITATDSVLG